ncbi:MAG: T9SS type A sorting domain-containing protein [Bacteroidetes bacterium]|nr:T9SS type A sorting domain-containing protein [Bacteroidota bacterium]
MSTLPDGVFKAVIPLVETQLTILDLAGKKVAEQIFQASEGKNKTSIDVSRLSKSIYMLNVKSQNLNKQIKITLQ